ncbi:hypothetical protein [Glutamicibacter sp. NPDC087344]|uniref:hypothetical protein n=1 Tax=Glutamicibacter sp. NPDC087344 TaxID=3363994 RepID=UPI00381F55DF
MNAKREPRFSEQVVSAYAELTKHQARPDGRGWICEECGFKDQRGDDESFGLHQIEAILPLLQLGAGEQLKTFPARIQAVGVGDREDRLKIELVARTGIHQDMWLLGELVLHRLVRVELTGYRQ